MIDISQFRQQVGQLVNSGQLVEARAACEQALSEDNANPDILALYGHVLWQSGDLPEAEARLRAAVDDAPDAAAPRQVLTEFLLELGKNAEAWESAKLACKLDADNPRGNLLLARAATRINQFEDARKALANLQPQKLITPQSQLIAGVLHHLLGDRDDADRYFKTARQHFPNETDYLQALSITAERNQHLRLAATCLQELLRLTPREVDLCDRLARLCDRLNRSAKAPEVFRPVMEQRDDAESHYRFAHYSLKARGDLEEIATHARRAIELDPKHDGAYGIMAQISAYKGDMGDAQGYVDRVLELEPGNYNLFLTLGDLITIEPGHPSFAAIEALQQNTEDDYVQSFISKALGKMYAAIEDYDTAFENFQRGNIARERAAVVGGKSYVPEKIEARTAMKARIFTKDFVESLSDCASDSDLPVFIVGLPRSGTSLLEQILSSHSRIAGAGELSNLPNAFEEFERLLFERGEQAAADIIRERAPKWREGLIESMMAAIDGQKGKKRPLRVIDKLPVNFNYLFLVAILFPKARVINLTRNPLDACLSIYTNSFRLSHDYATDLGKLGHFYHSYLEQIEHCRRELPLALMDANYEGMVRDTETQIRALIEFLGLDWEDACLAFDGATGETRTLSLVQVRSRINSASIGNWRKYEQHLGPLIDSVGKEATLP